MDKNSYISSIEIWCIGFRKKREERVLLMISSVKIIILLFSSSSLRVSWEKRRFFNHQDVIFARELAPRWDQEASDQIKISCEYPQRSDTCTASRDFRKTSTIISSWCRSIHVKIWSLFIYFYLIFIFKFYLTYVDPVYDSKIWSYTCLD